MTLSIDVSSNNISLNLSTTLLEAPQYNLNEWILIPLNSINVKTLDEYLLLYKQQLKTNHDLLLNKQSTTHNIIESFDQQQLNISLNITTPFKYYILSFILFDNVFLIKILKTFNSKFRAREYLCTIDKQYFDHYIFPSNIQMIISSDSIQCNSNKISPSVLSSVSSSVFKFQPTNNRELMEKILNDYNSSHQIDDDIEKIIAVL
jgi:hypothetical protein